ncbi:NUDIX hydrolase [Agathobacter rectalis]|uniref:NUDIX hydrolase n=1 Tax=Agathobacter rectalis TaxID=39491 RepID=A0A3E4LN30_9FIRM|nr:NUDIX hydrolase [Agathobacter rectalis]RGK38869.1 NUDIX hydrolase [Agathobacter rectalis]
MGTPEDAAIRETREEFGINIADIIPVTLVSGMSEEYCPSQVFLCTNITENRYVSIQRWKMPDLRMLKVSSI